MFYQKSIDQILKEFKTNKDSGLTFTEAQKRLAKYGPNILPAKKPESLLVKFLSQFKSLLILILLLSTVLSALLGDLTDALAIFAIVILNAAIGTYQEIKAEKTLDKLKSQDIPYSLVLRDKSVEKIPTREIVPGDILILEEGEKIPADARIIDSFQLQVDESILTGESFSVTKRGEILSESGIPLGDQYNMVFKDTKVVGGRGKAITIATGNSTEMGKIAFALEIAKEEKSPLTIELDRVGKMLTLVIIIIALAIFLITGLRDMPIIERILIAVALAVAAIPEGLPAIATITLALGVERLAGKKTIVKKLASVETLGSIKIIATDKTGTLTENKMNVTDIISASGKKYFIEGEGYSSIGTYYDEKRETLSPEEFPEIINLLTVGVLSSNAHIKSENNQNIIIGDTTEGALLVATQRAKIDIEELRKINKRLFEVPFSADRKMVSVVVEVDETGDFFLYTKGAPEEILKHTTLTAEKQKLFQKHINYLASKGLRTLGFAGRSLTKKEVDQILSTKKLDENDLIFFGLCGQKDTLRLDIKESLQKAKQAGITTIMITGDHIKTAAVIGIESGIIDSPDQAVSEKDIENISQKEIAKYVKEGKYRVFARISPLGKLKIIEALKLIPHTEIAVTGDGVNDAPALKNAHVGVAMGSGTDIAKEVADIVITDDDYTTLVEAVKEGRIILANIIKFIRYLISCNLAEIFVVSLAVIYNTPMPLAPIHLLWINLITDGLPALALGNDPPEPDVMIRPPRERNQILHRRRWAFMLLEGLLMGGSVFLLYLFSLNNFDIKVSQTIAFTTLAFTQLIHALSNRSTRKSIFEIGIFTNPLLIWSILASLVLQLLTIYTDFGQLVFKTSPMNLQHWLLIFGVSLIPFLFVESKKLSLKKLKK